MRELNWIPAGKRGRHSTYQVEKHNYFKSRKKRHWQVSQKAKARDTVQCCMFLCFLLLGSLWNPCRVLVSILGSSPGLCMLLGPQEAYSKCWEINEFDCTRLFLFHGKNPEEGIWHLGNIHEYIFLIQIYYTVCFLLFLLSDYNYFYLQCHGNVSLYMYVCVAAYQTHIWILFTLICFSYPLAELKSNGGYFNIYEAHLPAYLAGCPKSCIQ